MRASEFINEGWFDNAPGMGMARSAANSVRNAANAVKTSKVGSAVGKTVNTVGNFVNQDLLPAATQLGSAVRQGANTYRQSKIDRIASENFAKKFLQQIEYNRQSAQRQGLQFSLPGFVTGYMQKYHWQPGQFKPQLDKAVAANDLYNLPKIMAQIGKANTSIQGGREIAGSFVDPKAQQALQQQQTQSAFRGV